MNKQKISLTTQLEDMKRLADAEGRDRSSLLTKFKSLTTELESTRERIDNEHQRKSDALKALSKAQAEIQLWRSRYETEGMGRVDELEAGRGKLQARIQEAEETIEQLNSKIANSEKSRSRMQADLEEISLEYERTHAAAIINEKRGKNFDRVSLFYLIILYSLLNSEFCNRSLPNGRPRLMISVLRSTPATRKPATTTANSSVSALPMKNPLNNSISSSAKTRISPMKSVTSLINSVMVAAPSMNWTNNVVALRWRRRNSKPLLRRLRLPLNKRRTKFFVPNSNLDKCAKKLTARSRRRKKSSTTPGKFQSKGIKKYQSFNKHSCLSLLLLKQ